MSSGGHDAWYHQLSLLKPAPYRPWLHALRISLGTSAPLFLGWLTGHMSDTIFIAIGAFLTAITVRLDPYPERFRQIAISSCIALTGCFLGPLVAGHGVLTLLMLCAVGLVSGIISGYGAAFSVGALNMLVLTIITAHLYTSVSPMLIFGQFVIGALFVALLLGAEALINRDRPERRMLGRLIEGVAALARAVAGTTGAGGAPQTTAAVEAARRNVTDASKTAYDALIEHRSHGRIRTRFAVRSADILGQINQLTFALVSSAGSGESLMRAAVMLDRMARAYMENGHRPDVASDPGCESGGDVLFQRINALADAIWPQAHGQIPSQEVTSGSSIPQSGGSVIDRVRRRLVVGPEVVKAAVRLAVALGVAVVVGQWASGDHSYWVPMTVAVILKPDFGSVFLRGIHRSIGTMIGVVVAAVVTMLLHQQIELVIVIAVICVFIPLAGLRSYAAMVSLLTPVVLLILTLAMPSDAHSDMMQRLLDTLLGTAIALIFGYLIWPRSQDAAIAVGFGRAMTAVNDMLALATRTAGREEADTFGKELTAAQFAAYRRLSDLRTQVQRMVAEPPPAGREAAAWFPAVAGAERLCDRIGAFAGNAGEATEWPDPARISAAAGMIEQLGSGSSAGAPVEPPAQGADSFGPVEAEIAWLAAYIAQQKGRTKAVHPPVRD